MAEAMLRNRLEARGIDVHVHSAGLQEGGYPVTEETSDVLSRRGLDASSHESRQLSPDLLRGADLVIGMARRHVVEAVVMAPQTWTKAFTLKEFVRRAEGVGARAPEMPLTTWLTHVAGIRNRSELLGESPVDDVRDPVTEPMETTFEAAAAEIEGLINKLVNLIWGRG
jgi:protein-tyrosine-phosphatase